MATMERTSQRSCLDSYVQFYCRHNFPMCDEQTGTTIPVCLADCENAFINCGMEAGECTDDRVFRNIDEGGGIACDPE